MYLPPPLIHPSDHAGSTTEPSQLHLTGHSYTNAQDAVVVAAADTKWTHNGEHFLLHLWEWAASQVTSWANHASLAYRPLRGSHATENDQSHHILDLSPLRKRETSQDLDNTIGVIVGVLVGVFVLGTLAFCYAYRNSIRFKRKQKFRRQRRRHTSGGSHGSKSSKSSRSSASSAGGDGGGGGGGGGDAEPAPAPAAPAEGG
ncbi:7 transmembrane receptor (rhodopsin family) domain-containing protein [Apiospora rasikravindrae]|uniref:7 transmembrane receptor (Rhodopsin family) domain-containing protein n=1 Tax=Apiospora rasikravindrae TaxID=990691 RepID=A0ABR1RXI7_9PEZI